MIYEFQCQTCGWIIEANRTVSERDDVLVRDCVMTCKFPTWKRIPSVPAEPRKEKLRFPHVSHLRENIIEDDGAPGTRRVVFQSRSQMEQYMRDNDYVHYEEPVKYDPVPKMPDHIKKLEELPIVRKYLDLKASGRIPKPMILTEEQLHERFVT